MRKKPAAAPAGFRLSPAPPTAPPKPPRRRKPPVSLTDEQFLALLQQAKEHRLRDWILILFAYCHGLRASEPLTVTEADIDLREGKVFIRRGKGSEGGWQDLMSWPDNPLLDERTALTYWLANRVRFGVKGGAKPGRPGKSKFGSDAGGACGQEAGLKPAGHPTRSNKTPEKMQQSREIVAFSQKGGCGCPHGCGLECDDQGRCPVCWNGGRGCPYLFNNTSHFSPSNEGPNQYEDQEVSGPEPQAGVRSSILEASTPPPAPSERLFPISRGQFWRLVHKYALAAGIPERKCKTHMLKHTIAKHLVRAGHPVNEIMEWMGWRSMETMMWYIRADEEEVGHRIGDTLRAKQGLRPVVQGSLFP